MDIFGLQTLNKVNEITDENGILIPEGKKLSFTNDNYYIRVNDGILEIKHYADGLNIVDEEGNTGLGVIKLKEISSEIGYIHLTDGVRYITNNRTSDYNISYNDHIIFVSGASSSVDLTLPPPIVGITFIIKCTDISNPVSVLPNSTELIDGQTEYAFSYQYEAITLVSNGTNWFLI